MASSDLDVARKACLEIGSDPISGFGPPDQSAEATYLDNMFETLVKAELSVYPWRFTSKEWTLSREVDIPSNTEWDASYVKPADAMNLTGVFVSGEPIKYDIVERHIFCNAGADDVVVAEGQFRCNTGYWPPYFEMGMIYRIAANLAMAVPRKADMFKELNEFAEMWLMKARTRDSQSKTTKAIKQSRFTSNRRYRSS